MTSVVQVHLKRWILDDGAVEPFGVGDRVELGLAIDVEQLPVVADHEDANGVTPLPTPSSWDRVRARADVVGPLQWVLDTDGAPFLALITPSPDVPLVLIGRGVADPEWNGRRVIVRGDVVVEPYLWADGGVVRASVSTPIRSAVVDRIQTLAFTADTDAPAPLTDVAETVPYRQNAADHLVDLRFDPW